ncbi:Not1 N-terminal domain, CCR4-Not complex component-domain-containing protein [Multifurca ochricompacta]|uniref:General negative regulator of transcription subunit n=1 Tax=Multifurca ochricompacta TaxID=376703 RepID=A0AAD4M2K9_9AGAM|nr:Not1 N-terminal domain, CCR4-Not complex component-domain-containing protein [Multifurca ochricompacta]
MAARKLQTEIDRTLKKVAEGVELFESIYDKMQASTNQTQKEKLETDLKTQIKKLQRLRDQIKTWVASNDIKDKSALLENRRLIETETTVEMRVACRVIQMEKFKACEKEMKTKAFSKEGLIQSAKLDPKAQEKLEHTQWLQTCVEELLLQVETAEAEIETLQQGGRKKGKWHISRLEIMLRLLDNGTLSTEQVQGLKDDVNYFVEDNAGAVGLKFGVKNDDYDEDVGMYDDLNLDEEEEKFGRLITDDHDSDGSDDASEAPAADLPPRTPSKKYDEESMASSKRDESSPILKKAGVALQLRKHSTASEAPKPPPNPNFAQQPMSSILKAGLPPSQPRPPLKYATAAAAAVTPSASQQSNASASSAPTNVASPAPPSAPAPALPPPKLEPVASTTVLDHITAVTSSPSLTQISTSSPFLSSTSASAQQPDGSFGSPLVSEAESHPEPSSSVSAPSPLGAGAHEPLQEALALSATPELTDEQTGSAWHAPAPITPAGASSASVPEVARSPAPLQLQQQQTLVSSPLPPPAHAEAQQPQYPPGVKLEAQRPPSALPQQQQQQVQRNAFPGSLSDLVASFENVKQKAAHRMTNLEQVHKLLDGGYSNMPQPQDTEKPKYYVPRNPYQAPTYYPQTTNLILSSPRLFAQLDVETLFYVFYFLPGTYQQFLAAKELKRQSWRFHVKYLTWFQRHSEPQAITEEYEQGVYVYFDWEGSWCQRKKSDFRFEYRYLSED